MCGLHRTVFNHVPGPCQTLEGVVGGSEDIVTLPNGLAFISSVSVRFLPLQIHPTGMLSCLKCVQRADSTISYSEAFQYFCFWTWGTVCPWVIAFLYLFPKSPFHATYAC